MATQDFTARSTVITAAWLNDINDYVYEKSAINVKNPPYNAKGDGVTDDITSINSAIDTLVTAGGGELTFPEGTYIVGSPIKLRSNIVYQGHGWGTIIKHKPGISSVNIFGEASPSAAQSNIVVRDLQIDGNRANVNFDNDDANGNGIRLNQVSHSRFENLYIHDTVFNAISVYNASNDNIIARSRIENIGKTGACPGACTWIGVFLESGVNRNLVIGNRIDTTRQFGIAVNSIGAASRDNRLVDNFINATTEDGIRIGNDDQSGAGQPLQRTLVHGNIVGGVTGATSQCIRLYHAGTGGNAGTVDYTELNGNVCTGGAQHGFLVASTAVVDTNIIGNYALSNTGTGILNSGLRSTIIGNTSRLNGTDYSDTGTSTVEAGNTFDTSGLFKAATPGGARHPVPNILASVGTAVSAPADTNDNTLASISIPANSMKTNGAIRVTGLMTVTNSANNKTTRVKFGGTTFAFSTVTTVATVPFSVTIVNRNATNSQVAFPGLDFNAQGGAASTAAIDTTAAQTLAITAQKASGGETMTLEWYAVELIVPNL